MKRRGFLGRLLGIAAAPAVVAAVAKREEVKVIGFDSSKCKDMTITTSYATGPVTPIFKELGEPSHEGLMFTDCGLDLKVVSPYFELNEGDYIQVMKLYNGEWIAIAKECPS